jgi:large subunit ribosomal protein L10
LPTKQKIDRVSALKEKLERCTIAVTADYTGISVNEMTELRRRMRAIGVEFTVVKNTLIDLAAEAASRPQFKEIVQGPTAVAFGYDDPLVVAKILADYIRTTRTVLAIRGAVMGDGPAMAPAEVSRLAALPGKPQLVAAVMAQLQSPIQRLMVVLNSPIVNFSAMLQARMRQLDSSESDG